MLILINIINKCKDINASVAQFLFFFFDKKISQFFIYYKGFFEEEVTNSIKKGNKN